MHYVSERWLGGTLTNFRTIRARLQRLDELDKLWDTAATESGYAGAMLLPKFRKRVATMHRLNEHDAYICEES